MLGRIPRAIRAFSPQARLFFVVIVGLAFVVDGVYNVLLNLYLLRLGYGTEFIGLVNAAGLLAFAFTSLPAGILGSRYSVTGLMKFGAVLSLIGGTLLTLTEAIPAGLQEGWLVFQYALMLGGFAFFFVNGAPFLINVVDNAYKHHAFALKTAHWSLAGFAGSLVGGILPGIIANMNGATLDDPAPYRLTLTLATVVLALSTLLIMRIRPLQPRIKRGLAESDSSAAHERMSWTASLITLIVIMTLIRLFQVAGSATALVYFNVYMDQHLALPTVMIGAIAAFGRLMGVPAALLTPWLVRRWGNVNVIIGASLIASLSLVPMALVEHWLAAAIGFVFSLAMMSIRYTSFVVYILDLVPRAQQAVMAGSGEMAAGLSFAVMALGGGIILSLFAFRDLFLLGALLSFIGTATFWLYILVTKPKRKLKPAL